MTAVHWKLTIAWPGGAGKKGRRRKGKPPPAHKVNAFAGKRTWIIPAPGAPALRLRDVCGAHAAAPGAGPERCNSGWAAFRFHVHQPEQFLKPHATRLKFREQQFTDVRTPGTGGIRAARLGQRFFCWLLPSSIRHGRPLSGTAAFEIRRTIPSAGTFPRCKLFRPASSRQPWYGRPTASPPGVRYVRRPCPRWYRGRGRRPNSSEPRGFHRYAGPRRKWPAARRARWEPVHWGGLPPAVAAARAPHCRSWFRRRRATGIVPLYLLPLVPTDLPSFQVRPAYTEISYIHSPPRGARRAAGSSCLFPCCLARLVQVEFTRAQLL